MSDEILLCFCSGNTDIGPIRTCRWRNIAGVEDVDKSSMGNGDWGMTLYTCEHGKKASCESGVCPVPELDALVNVASAPSD